MLLLTKWDKYAEFSTYVDKVVDNLLRLWITYAQLHIYQFVDKSTAFQINLIVIYLYAYL